MPLYILYKGKLFFPLSFYLFGSYLNKSLINDRNIAPAQRIIDAIMISISQVYIDNTFYLFTFRHLKIIFCYFLHFFY